MAAGSNDPVSERAFRIGEEEGGVNLRVGGLKGSVPKKKTCRMGRERTDFMSRILW